MVPALGFVVLVMVTFVAPWLLQRLTPWHHSVFPPMAVVMVGLVFGKVGLVVVVVVSIIVVLLLWLVRLLTWLLS